MIGKGESFPKKSAGYLYAQSVFFIQFNEVDFFVEDVEQESLYFVILRKLFPDIRIEKIFPLGGKALVIGHAIAQGGGRAAVYILDKDFDDLLKTMVEVANLFYLERYAIENFVFEIGAIMQFIISQKLKLKRTKVEAVFDIARFIKETKLDLRELFCLFFLVQKYALPDPSGASLILRNCDLPATCFVQDSDPSRIDAAKVAKYEKTVKQTANKLGIDIQQSINAFEAEFELNSTEEPVGRHISGKFLLRILLNKIGNLFGGPGVSMESATYRISEYCQFQSLYPLRDDVCKYLAGVSAPASK